MRARLLSPAAPEQLTWLDDAVVRVQGGVLVEVVPFDGRPVDLDLRPSVLLPGFVDAHVHAAQTGIVGAATGPLLDWLHRSVFPAEARLADPTTAKAVATAFCQHLARAGTTTCVAYASVHPASAHAVFAAMAEAGLQGFVGPVWMDEDCPDALKRPVEATLEGLDALHAAWHGHDHGRLQLAVLPRFALSCSRELLAAAGAYAADHGLLVSSHLAEHPAEAAAVCDRFRVPDYLTVYEQAGLVHDRAVFAHCVHLADDAWDRLAAAGAAVAHCPDSNDFLGSGGMPLRPALDRGIRVGIGTDVAAGRSFRVPRILSAAHDNALRQRHRLSLARLLWWGTRGGALALGMSHTGWLQPGAQADLCLFEPPPGAETAEAVLGALLFDHDGPEMARTWVRGHEVWPLPPE